MKIMDKINQYSNDGRSGSRCIVPRYGGDEYGMPCFTSSLPIDLRTINSNRNGIMFVFCFGWNRLES